MNKANLTEEQAFLAMYSFLSEYYRMTNSNDVGSLLGGISLLQDGGTADPAMKADWLVAVKRALNGEVKANLELRG